MLNDEKTEYMLLGTKQQLAKVDINSITVGAVSYTHLTLPTKRIV